MLDSQTVSQETASRPATPADLPVSADTFWWQHHRQIIALSHRLQDYLQLSGVEVSPGVAREVTAIAETSAGIFPAPGADSEESYRAETYRYSLSRLTRHFDLENPAQPSPPPPLERRAMGYR